MAEEVLEEQCVRCEKRRRVHVTLLEDIRTKRVLIETLQEENDMLKGRIEWFQDEFEIDLWNKSLVVERLKNKIDEMQEKIDAYEWAMGI